MNFDAKIACRPSFDDVMPLHAYVLLANSLSNVARRYFGAFLFLCLTLGLCRPALSQPVKNTNLRVLGESFKLCSKPQSFPLFNCRLQSGDSVALCISEQDLKMYYVQHSRTGQSSTKNVVNAEQSLYIARQSATVYLYLDDVKVTVITDDSQADNTNPEVSTETKTSRRDEFCTSESNDSGVFVTIHGKSTFLDIGNLAGLGLAKLTEDNSVIPKVPQ